MLVVGGKTFFTISGEESGVRSPLSLSEPADDSDKARFLGPFPFAFPDFGAMESMLRLSVAPTVFRRGSGLTG